MSSQKKRHRRKLEEEVKRSSRETESSKAKQLAEVVVEKAAPKSVDTSANQSKEETKETEIKQSVNAAVEVNEKRNGNEPPGEVIIILDESEASEDKPEPELEPLVADADDPELQFDNISDADSLKGSPSVNRCATRRSQTRNIPTPITPKSICEVNGEEKNVEKTNGIDGSDRPSMETPQTESSRNQEKNAMEPEVVDMDSISLVVEESVRDGPEEASPNTSLLSTHVNIGNDTTREIDISLPDENSFLNSAKDLSVVETLRRMTSRRAIRGGSMDYRRTLLKSQAERHEMLLQHPRASIERITGSKRKTRSKTPEDSKRFKPDNPSGFLSYISSPISMLRNRFAGPESISASTPKLTSYREQELIDGPEVSAIKESKPTDKKRCTIM